MKAKHLKHFQVWIKAMVSIDPRLDARDFNKLVRLYKRSFNV